MTRISENREIWLARNILPNEAALRRHIARWQIPAGLEVDDVVQECYGNIAMKDTVVDIRHPRSYLFTVARRVILKHLRKARVQPIHLNQPADFFELESEDPSPEQQVSDREQLHILASAVAQLPQPGREALLMRVIEDMPFQEIGLKLGISENAVQKNVSKTIQKLADLLGRGGITGSSASRRISSKESCANVAARD